jgi:hypothetical protein
MIVGVTDVKNSKLGIRTKSQQGNRTEQGYQKSHTSAIKSPMYNPLKSEGTLEGLSNQMSNT